MLKIVIFAFMKAINGNHLVKVEKTHRNQIKYGSLVLETNDIDTMDNVYQEGVIVSSPEFKEGSSVILMHTYNRYTSVKKNEFLVPSHVILAVNDDPMEDWIEVERQKKKNTQTESGIIYDIQRDMVYEDGDGDRFNVVKGDLRHNEFTVISGMKKGITVVIRKNYDYDVRLEEGERVFVRKQGIVYTVDNGVKKAYDGICVFKPLDEEKNWDTTESGIMIQKGGEVKNLGKCILSGGKVVKEGLRYIYRKGASITIDGEKLYFCIEEDVLGELEDCDGVE